MSTAPAGGTLAAIAHLDWPVQPCEEKRCSGGRPPATHVIRNHFPCQCRPFMLVCSPCADITAAAIRRYGGQPDLWRCITCNRRYQCDLALYLTVRPL